MAVLSSDLIRQGASGASTGYTIDQSIRFNQGDNAYMHRTPSGAGNRRTWTWSGWLKHSQESTNGYHNIWTARSGSNDYFEIAKRVTAAGDNHMDIINKISNTTGLRLVTNRDFRDPAAWYHFVFVADTTNVDPSARFRFYVNGIRETSFETETLPSQNYDTYINTTNKHEIGAYNGGSGYMMDGYMADINFIDGYAYGPEYFGEFKTDTDIWIPKEYTGSYGTNGYHIDGRDSGDLGDDESGNGNDYTTSGMAAHDQIFDSPTNNFCVLNPIDKPAYGSYAVRNITGTMLQVTENGDGAVQSYGMGTMAVSSGKWYYEFYCNTHPAGNAIAFGWIELENSETATDSGSSWKHIGMNQRHTSSAYSSWTWALNSQTATSLTPFGQGVTIGVTTDFDNNTFVLTKDGSAYGSVDFDSVSPTYALSGVLHKPLFFWGADGSSLATLNFGQDSTFNGAVSAGGNADQNGNGNFKYAVPSGALALCSLNLGAE